MRAAFAVSLFGLFGLAACAAQAPLPSGVAAGAQTYRALCAVCHGPQGQGDGPLAAQLDTSPSDLTRIAARNGGVFPHAQVIARIHGYPGQFDEMPDYGPLFAGPTIGWRDPQTGAVFETPSALVDLADYLATIQKA